MMFDKLCRGWSSRVHRTEIVTTMGHKRPVAASSITSNQCDFRFDLFFSFSFSFTVIFSF